MIRDSKKVCAGAASPAMAATSDRTGMPKFVLPAGLVLDWVVQIRLFGKLKLARCARPELRVGLFHALGDSMAMNLRDSQ